MTNRVKWLIIALTSLVALGGTGVVGALAWRQQQARLTAPSQVLTTPAGEQATGNRLVFRNTALGQGYGHLASVALADPGGARSLTDVVCDRVDATSTEVVCLRTERGILPSHSAALHSHDGQIQQRWPLAGIPSRTRLSPDGTLVATTAFVTGHSYSTIGFSTETVIRTRAGESLGSLEEWVLVLDGARSAPLDRNYWGVTFVDDNTFYATVATAGTTHLVHGDIAARTLASVVPDVECPSVSPDGTRIAFKRVTAGSGPTVHWTPAVMDLTTGAVEVLPEPRNVDDQIEWLDAETILYGLPRDDQVGDYDVWALPVDGSGTARVFVEHAWSPAVVRG